MFNLIQMMGKPGGLIGDEWTPPADDSPLVLNNDTAPTILVLGDTTNANIFLRDLATIDKFFVQTIVNMSSNFIGVFHSDGSNMVRVGPCGSLMAWSDGTKWCCSLTEPESYEKFRSVLIGGRTTAEAASVRNYTIGGGVLGVGAWGNNSVLGGIYMRADVVGQAAVTANSNDGSNPSFRQNYLSKGKAFQAQFISIRTGEAAPAAGSEFAHRLGLLDNVTATQPTNGVYLEIREDLNINGVARSAGAEVMQTSAIPYSLTGLQKKIIEINHDATRADFWVGDNHIAQPVGAYTVPKSYSFVGSSLIKTAGAITGTAEREQQLLEQFSWKLAFDSADRSDA